MSQSNVTSRQQTNLGKKSEFPSGHSVFLFERTLFIKKMSYNSTPF